MTMRQATLFDTFCPEPAKPIRMTKAEAREYYAELLLACDALLIAFKNYFQGGDLELDGDSHGILLEYFDGNTEPPPPKPLAPRQQKKLDIARYHLNPSPELRQAMREVAETPGRE